MKERIRTIIIGMAIFLPLVWIGSWPLEIFLTFLSLVALFELYRMKGIKTFSLSGIAGFIGMIAFVLGQHVLSYLPEYLQNFYPAMLIFPILLTLTVLDTDYDFEDAGVTLLGIFYIGFGFQSFINVRQESLHLLIMLLLIVWSTDSGAYLVGRKLGEHKMAPNLSPNKTIEGSIGGLVFAMVVGFIYTQFITFAYSNYIMIFLVLVLSVACQLGDLIESSLKRHFEVKDSGASLPGHGGILDRFDSMLFVLSLAVLMGLA